MKNNIIKFMDWFEDRFNYIIELIALIGGVFSIVLSIVLFVALVIGVPDNLFGIEVVLLPGFVGFLGIGILIALRIVRFLTKQEKRNNVNE